ncbi:glycosyltransferase [Microbacterium ulmi]|uniref:Glycosyltransferase family 4 protein n=1 Tax=Microbacterium ulmi TaxID=179095 RepID=A0A7Y2LYS6_9MICO|nr:glycosyltransferase involved in cell wall biosynthesis [Microbacterium ulmi]NNH03262.1 glycosyltransferase family 4 protein [Microbacterium ulmi]
MTTPVYHVITPGDHYSPRTGSAVPTVVHGLATAARDGDGDPRYRHAVVLQADTYRPRYDSADLVEFDGVPAPSARERYLDAALGRVGGPRRNAARYFQPAVSSLLRQPAGIVLAHNATVVPWLLRDSDHVPVLYAHNDILRTYTRRESARSLSSAALIVAVSESLAAQLKEHLPTSLHDRVRIVGNGVDTAAFTPAPPRQDGPLRVMFFGRAIPEKGADILLTAAAGVERSDVEYVIIGSHGFDPKAPLSPFETRLRELASSVRGTVRFEAFVERPALPGLLRSADMLVLPSRWPDPCPLTVGEALASGVPVIASRRGGIPEALGDAGILFDPDRPEELTAAISSLAGDPVRRRELGAAGRARAEDHDWAWAWGLLAKELDGLAV